MTPLAEQLLRVMAMGRSKQAAMARVVLLADGYVVEAPPQGPSMTPEAVRQRRRRAGLKGVAPPVTPPGERDTVTPDVTLGHAGGVGGDSLSSSGNLGEKERESLLSTGVTHADAVTPVTLPVTAPTSSDSAELGEITGIRKRDIGDMSRPHVTPPVTLVVTAGDPLPAEMKAVALKAGLGEDAIAHVWDKFTAFYDGKRVTLPRDWRLWCVREKQNAKPEGRAGPVKATEAPEAAESRERARKSEHEKLRREAVPAPVGPLLAAVGLKS